MQDFDSMLNVAAIPQDEKKAAFVSESRENRARCYEMSEQMTEEVAANAETFRQYLDTQSRFDRYNSQQRTSGHGTETGCSKAGRLRILERSGSICTKE